jgi:hypothetical protein
MAEMMMNGALSTSAGPKLDRALAGMGLAYFVG